MDQQTPMVKQYLEIKSKNKDSILFFRLGDFYEMFYEDADLASRELELTLTGRGQGENKMPMCGVPYHAAENYIARLVTKGYKVAICEQVEDPALAKGLVKREIIKVYTPGTVIESSMLLQKANNYLLAVSYEKGKFGISYVDVSTGEFKVTEIEENKILFDEINRINPSEILFSDMWQEEVPENLALRISKFKDNYDAQTASDRLKKHFNVVSLASFGIDNYSVGLSAAAYVVDYLEETQKTALLHINKIVPYRIGEYMFIDSSARRNLELVQTMKDKSFRGSLLWVLDHCCTNMGSRLLRNWLLMPLMNVDEINKRLDAVSDLKENTILRAELSEKLKKVFDIERLTTKIASSSANAKDLVALRDSLNEIPFIKNLILEAIPTFSCSKDSLFVLSRASCISDLPEVKELVNLAIVNNPPFQIKDGGLIRDGYNLELDELRTVTRGGKSFIAELENSERIKTGIKSLKVGFNRVFGYYIEVTTSNLSQVPQNYIRKQTLTNCERYITPELKEKEALVLNADEKIKELEYNLFCEIREEVSKYTLRLQEIAHILAALDVFIAFADIASYGKYCRPKFSSDADNLHPYIHLIDSRHPVVEKSIGEHNFISNNIEINEESRFLLITGPNMAGKSTIMKQAALILIMAQMGSFVPAKEANLSVTDRIFTRIGAMDDIFSGQSTFMLEMTETANILNNATNRSFIILDEIGRGTSTFDGMSIAAAVAEYIHKNIKARTMFATHYHEITQLADKHRGMKNFNVAVKEENDHITFLHKIIDGPADKSYGIQVARLAGLPVEVVLRSKEIYSTLEMVENNLGENSSRSKEAFTLKKIGKSRFKREEDNQVSLF